MTGPEHYLEAERLAQASLQTSNPEQRAALAAVAQVNATLALAAATIAAPFVGEGNTTEAWLHVTSGTTAAEAGESL